MRQQTNQYNVADVTYAQLRHEVDGLESNFGRLKGRLLDATHIVLDSCALLSYVGANTIKDYVCACAKHNPNSEHVPDYFDPETINVRTTRNGSDKRVVDELNRLERHQREVYQLLLNDGVHRKIHITDAIWKELKSLSNTLLAPHRPNSPEYDGVETKRNSIGAFMQASGDNLREFLNEVKTRCMDTEPHLLELQKIQQAAQENGRALSLSDASVAYAVMACAKKTP